MKRTLTWLALPVLLVGMAICLQGTASDGVSLPASSSSLGFGQKIAGTYFSPAGPFGGTLTLFADGTVSGISGSCCGNAGNVQSEAFGNWVRTGPRQIQLRTVVIGTLYDFDGMDTPDGPTGNFIATPMEVLDFANDFQSFTGTLCTAVWFYDLGGAIPDVEVDPPVVLLGPFDIGMSRLAVFVECPG